MSERRPLNRQEKIAAAEAEVEKEKQKRPKGLNIIEIATGSGSEWGRREYCATKSGYGDSEEQQQVKRTVLDALTPQKV